ncbi:nucleotidyltransferase domain-containing protein [Candidatus Micrarchaeota archaeon]|nr:nucleotidyltransferase domain-containing protein [Candidatus Micrarchaeota archaeon]
MFKKLNLFSKTEMKVLNFISEKDGELFERQIARESGVSTGSANSILNAFARIGFLKQTRKGKMLFYKRNDGNPLLRQFKVFTAISSLMPLIEKIAPLAARVVLFGSCAQGRNGEKSDVDLFVLTREKDRVRRIVSDNPQIQAILLDGAEYARLEKGDKPLYGRINAGIELYGSDESG